ncbi:hypothetical protein [Rhodopseudomonas sp.]|uniref:hypothetical protein n=1 Tax=Rhodopseudomonas sp. TaxID=1078 RepID=UPI0025CD7EDC|nr:hypothetical protein [Rhodopseudomonas sp.]
MPALAVRDRASQNAAAAGQRGRLVRLPRRRGQRPKASPDALAAILDALEIELIGTAQTRRDHQTAAGETLRNLLALYGSDHVTFLLRTVRESSGNERALTDPILRAISAVMLAFPAWPDTGLRWIETFDGLPLVEMYTKARPLKYAAPASAWAFLAGMIAERLYPVFEAPTVAKLSIEERRNAKLERKAAERARRMESRATTNSARIEIGQQLIEMKRTAGYRQFTRLAMRRFDELRCSHQPAEYMNVAVRYADRPAILQGLSWQVIALLSSPTLPEDLRSEFERRIEAGERVTPSEIAARRAAHPEAPKGSR